MGSEELTSNVSFAVGIHGPFLRFGAENCMAQSGRKSPVWKEMGSRDSGLGAMILPGVSDG